MGGNRSEFHSKTILLFIEQIVNIRGASTLLLSILRKILDHPYECFTSRGARAAPTGAGFARVLGLVLVLVSGRVCRGQARMRRGSPCSARVGMRVLVLGTVCGRDRTEKHTLRPYLTAPARFFVGVVPGHVTT